MQKLTQRQQAVLEYIVESIQDRGYPPTLREIGNHLGIRSTNGVNDHLRALERKGYLTREDMKSRTLRPTTGAVRPNGSSRTNGSSSQLHSHASVPEVDDVDMVDIPILGRVAAGLPLEAVESAMDTVRIDRMLLGATGEIYGLRIVGDSMIEAGIHDGDYVFVKKQLEARRGQIVVCMVGDEATCKHFYPEKQHIRLEPANSQMAPILIPRTDWRETSILGVVVGVFRKV
ncbi:MAG: transcriptional repressor LexA [Sandaracinaceae bacterium]|nr:transcriptional repressor LexA [Sandaracinaceae bacterium]